MQARLSTPPGLIRTPSPCSTPTAPVSTHNGPSSRYHLPPSTRRLTAAAVFVWLQLLPFVSASLPCAETGLTYCFCLAPLWKAAGSGGSARRLCQILDNLLSQPLSKLVVEMLQVVVEIGQLLKLCVCQTDANTQFQELPKFHNYLQHFKYQVGERLSENDCEGSGNSAGLNLQTLLDS